MVLIKGLVFAGFAAAVAAKSAVLDLIPSNFDKVAISGKPALVEFFAPWCGHCKTLAPVYEELAQAFQHASDKVVIAKVDADSEKSLGRRFGIQGFPTIKFFDGVSDKPVDYKGGRDLESLTKFITEKTGVKGKKAKTAQSEVQMLTDTSFRDLVGKDKDVLVAFTAPWCGHCKTLAPVWEDVASDFAADKHVIIAKVDAEAENSKATSKSQGVSSYPTIKFFPKGSTEPVDYEGPRTEKDLLKFVNDKAGTFRIPGGGLTATAGTVAAFDAVIEKFKSGTSITELAVEAGQVALTLRGEAERKFAEYYVKVFSKLATSKDFAEKEFKRLEGMLSKGKLGKTKEDEMIMKSNILKRFLGNNAAHREL